MQAFLGAVCGAILTLATIAFARAMRRGAAASGPPNQAVLPDLEGRVRQLGALERAFVERLVHRKPIRDPNAAFDEQLSLGQRVADQVAKWGGSWTFIGSFLVFMAVWMVLNTRGAQHFDPFPFILLNLVLSCLAALQAPVIMMSQNRQNAKDRYDARQDYEVNLRAEMEIAGLHAKLDEQRAKDWVQLVEIQQRQLEFLQAIARKLDCAP